MGVSPATGAFTAECLCMALLVGVLCCKVWGVCELQASNLSCNLPSLIHSMRRTICCHKKEQIRELLGIKYVLVFRCCAARGHISRRFMMCCWISGFGESGGCWRTMTLRPYLPQRDMYCSIFAAVFEFISS